jgi:putative DNA-invertase from lambdoid prophage Rac
LNESLNLTTPSGRAMAGMLAVFAEFERERLRERVRAGLAEARSKGQTHGRPATAKRKQNEIEKLSTNGKGLSKAAIAKKLKISRAPVIRLWDEKSEN